MTFNRVLVARTLAVAVCLGLILAWPGRTGATVQPQHPFLWKATSPLGTLWLFGTIHVPEVRVLTLHPAVAAAVAESRRVVTEIPLDAAAQADMAGALLLPDGQRLRAIIGEARFGALTEVVRAALQGQAPLTVSVLVGMLDGLRPWAAMAQLATLEYLPQLLAGRTALDVQIYADAQAAGKEVGGLETVQEQAAVFDAFSTDEQLVLLDVALARVTNPAGAITASGLVDVYLKGDGERLAEALEQGPENAALARKFREEVLVARNHRMAARIDALRRQHPQELQFFAVGALHLVGPDNLPQLLAARGYDIARVRP